MLADLELFTDEEEDDPIEIIDLEDNTSLNILVYGVSGTGKTVFCGSDDKVLFIAPEDKGTLSAKRSGSSAKRIKIDKWEKLMRTYYWLYDILVVQKKKFDWEWLAIDSLTEMQDMAKDYVLRMTKNQKERKGEDPELMQLQDYGKLGIIMENLIRAFNDLPINVVYTALEKTCVDGNKNEFMCPQLGGKKDYLTPLKIASFMSAYGYMETKISEREDPNNKGKMLKRTRRIITWENRDTIRAKDRTYTLAPRTVNKTLKQLREMIEAFGERPQVIDGVVENVTEEEVPAKTTRRKTTRAVTEKVEPNREEEKEEQTEDESSESEVVEESVNP